MAGQEIASSIVGRNGVEQRPLIRYKDTNLMGREGTSDLNKIEECFRTQKDVLVEGRVVFDLGANSGGFSVMAMEKGADQVVAFEPEPHTFKILQMNSPKSVNVRAAVIPGPEKEVKLYVGTGAGGPALASVLPRARRNVMNVGAANFQEMLDYWKPSTVKMDVEGAEFKLLPHLPEYVSELSVEIHGFDKRHKRLVQLTEDGLVGRGWVILRKIIRKNYGCLYHDLHCRR